MTAVISHTIASVCGTSSYFPVLLCVEVRHCPHRTLAITLLLKRLIPGILLFPKVFILYASSSSLLQFTMQPSLPIPSPNLSHWHQTTRSFPHLNKNSSANVPPSTQYLIIGSGICGALTAYELINGGISGKDVLILEAREAVSGATGRNAGHIRPG